MDMQLGDLGNKSALPAANSEATKIEQARAFSEVIVQAELAQRFKRNMQTVFERIDEVFELSPALIAASKFEYSRGGAKVAGYSIQFARAVASCVGNIHYSVKELSRGEEQTEMMCYAWDLESNAMQQRSFIVKHEQYAAKNPRQLVKERDIYENNSNVGGRRVRECLLGVLPASAVKHAERKVEELLAKAFPPERQATYAKKNIERFHDIGITKEMLVKNRGNRPPETWTKNDFSILASIWDAIEKGVSTKEEIFNFYANQNDSETTSDDLKKKLEGQSKTAKIEPAKNEEKLAKNALRLSELVNSQEYASTINSLIQSEELMPNSLETTNEKAAKRLVDLIEKTKGFEEAEAKEQKTGSTENDHF